MNPEGRKAFNTDSSMDKRIRKAIEQQDHTKASLGTNGQTQPSTSNPSQTDLQKRLAGLKSQQKLNQLKQQHPKLFPQNQTPNSPSASPGPSPG